MATAEQLATFQTAVASGNIQEAANIAASAGYSPQQVAEYVNANAPILGLGPETGFSGVTAANLDPYFAAASAPVVAAPPPPPVVVQEQGDPLKGALALYDQYLLAGQYPEAKALLDSTIATYGLNPTESYANIATYLNTEPKFEGVRKAAENKLFTSENIANFGKLSPAASVGPAGGIYQRTPQEQAAYASQLASIPVNTAVPLPVMPMSLGPSAAMARIQRTGEMTPEQYYSNIRESVSSGQYTPAQLRQMQQGVGASSQDINVAFGRGMTPITTTTPTMPGATADTTQSIGQFIQSRAPTTSVAMPTAPSMFSPENVRAQLELERLRLQPTPEEPVAGFAQGGLVGDDINRMLQNQRSAIQRESQSRQMLNTLGTPPVKKFSDGGPAGSSSGVRRLEMSKIRKRQDGSPPAGEITNDEYIQQQMMTGTPMSDTSTQPGILPPEIRQAIDVPLDFANLLIRGTAAVPIGGFAGLYKGITGGKYGTQEGVKEADTEAARMMAKITGEPKTQTAKDVLQFVGDKMQKYKLDAALPQLLTVPSPGAGTTEFIKQAVRSEFEAPPVGAVTLKPDASTDLETAAPAAGGASIRPEQLDQLTSQTVIRGQDIPPLTKIPTPEEIQVAKADTRMGQNIVADRLNIIVPETERVRGGIYRAGQPSGRPWSELTPEQLKQRDSGFKGTDDDLDKMWQETLSEVSEAGRIAVDRTGATWKAFPAKNWDNAFKLPLRNQLWYELSGEAFVDRMPDTTTREMLTFLDLIGATSARAKPLENLERSVAISAQKLQGVPVDVDVTIPSTVKDALRREGTNISSDLANKTGNFSDTLALTGGLPVRYPISVNDVWVGNAFGITDQQLGANQALHEVFARYMNKVRDFHNETGNPLYPHESWQVQARQWVEMRANALGIDTSKLDTVEGSDYAAEFDKVVKKLENAGISVPDGILTRDVLLDPRVPDALRATTKAFREAPKATVEFGTLLTPSGKRGAELFESAKAAGDELTQKEYLKVLTSSMYDSARGKPTPWQNLIRVATNRAESVTRIYSPTSQDPFAISGTFQGAAGPNIRIPFRDMTPDQIAYANAVAGSGLKQKAMAAAEIRRLTPGEALPEGFVPTNSLKFDIDGPVPESLLVDITKELGEGYEVSAMRYPDSIVVDINPKFGDAGPEAPDIDNIDRAVDMLRERYGARDPRVFNSGFRSEFGKNYVEDPGTGTEYNRIIQETLKGWNDEAITRITDLAGNGVKRSDISKFLAGKLDTLPVNSKQLPEGVALSSVRGRAETIRKQLRQRVSDHNAAVEAFASIGQSVDGAMAKAIPTWEKRAQSQRKKLTTASTAQPVARRRGKGTTSAAEDLAAVSLAAPAVSRVDMSYKDVTKRVPELTKGANDLLEGKITWEDYNALVDQYKPVTPYSFVPAPATAADAMKALDSRKQKSFAVVQEGIQAGENAELRLDIPAYKDHGVWVNSIHRSGQPTSYASISSIKNARMIGPDDVRLQEKALEVATGQKSKGPFAVIKGEWSPVSEKEAVARAQQYLNDPEWTQVGYDPERHSYFYDRTTTRPVVSADEVLQIGPLVLAKNAKFAKKEQFKFKDGGEVDAFIKAKAR